MSKDTQKQLIADHFLFKEGDRFLKEANASMKKFKSILYHILFSRSFLACRTRNFPQRQKGNVIYVFFY